MPKRLACAASVAVLALTWCIAAGQQSDVRPIDDFSYSSEKAAKLWEPMADSRPVSVVKIDGLRALRLPCRFQPGRVERASWDRKINVDLAACKGVQFRFRCRDASPVRSFTMYLRSGDGWYRGHFYGPTSDKWTTVRIHKSKTGIEGRPAGWGRIDTIRLSAWRSRNVDTEFHVAELGMFGTGGHVAIIRGDSGAAANPGEARAVQLYADVVVEFLDRAGVGHVVLSDRDVTAARLKGRKVAILPYNPSMPDAAADALAAFVMSGGKLIAAYTLPRRLQPLVGIKVGRHVQQKYKGYFAAIRASDTPLRGAPASAGQASWNVHEASPVAGASRVAAWWYSDKGETTHLPAVLVSENCVFLTHVLMADDAAAKQQLLLAMVGHLMPEAWAEAARGALVNIGRFEPYDGYEGAAAGIRKTAAGHEAAVGALNRAAKLRARAHLLVEQGRHVEAIAAAVKARAALLDAHCVAQKPRPGEHRAVWCHSAFGVAGMTWDQAARTLADNGFTAVLPNMLWGGVAYYDSDVLPVAPDVKDKGDQIALCLAACRKHGIQCHVWKVNYNMGSRTPKAFLARMKAAGRTQVQPDGSPNARWLCPSHPDNQKLEIDSMVEVARKYDVHGVHFDYIRYPGRQGCFCPGCRRRFEKAVGRKVTDWPADVRLGAALHGKWLDFRREQITAVVKAVAERARKVRPGVRISAAVFRDWPADRDNIGQDWKLWCDRGWLDFVCPMDYTPNSRQFESMVARQKPWAGQVPCCPGIGVSTWSDRTDVAKVIEQIRVTRRLKTGGFTIFNYDPALARDVLPRLGKGITRR